MDNDLIEKLEKINKDLSSSSEVKELLKLKDKILKDKELLNDLELLQKMDFNDKEYNEHEFGRNEDSLQILNIIFYKSDIKKIKSYPDPETQCRKRTVINLDLMSLPLRWK